MVIIDVWQLSQIVRVLNSHLQQLQVIDAGTAALGAKIDAAKKESSRLGGAIGHGGSINGNGWHGVGGDPAEEFYKSFMGRR
jgi:nuclear pore complex protein Nup62